MTKNTPFYQQHLAANAKMVDFAGWQMPINYGSQINEHHVVRQNAGVFDVSHMLAVDITGNDARKFLRFALANDIKKLDNLPGKALYSCMLNDHAGVIDDLIVYHLNPQHYRIVVNAGTAQGDLAWLSQIANDYSVTIKANFAWAMLAIQGPQAISKFCLAFPEYQQLVTNLQVFQGAFADEWFIARTGYTGEDGLEITFPSEIADLVWQKLLAKGISPCGLGARDTLRLEAGMCLYGQDMNSAITPYQCSLQWTVDNSDAERNYCGKKALAAKEVKDKLFGLLLLDKGGVLRAHQQVDCANGVGEITSGSHSPTLNQSIAFARLPLSCTFGEIVFVQIRDKLLKAQVVKLAFVKNGKILVDRS